MKKKFDPKAAALAQIKKMIDISDGLWTKGWQSSNGMPINAVTGRPYRGGNLWSLFCFVLQNGEFRFAGKGQATALVKPEDVFAGVTKRGKAFSSAKIKAGAKGTSIAVPMIFDKKDRATGEVITNKKGDTEKGVRFLWQTVFPVTAFQGFDESRSKVQRKKVDYKHEPDEQIERLDRIVVLLGCKRIEGPRAAYSPRNDTVMIPLRSDFQDFTEYAWTVAHEFIHATGHPDRVNRDSVQKPSFGKDEYAEEELVAELGAWFLSAHLGLDAAPNQKNAAAYLKGWGKRFEDDPEIMNRAAGKAWKAVTFILEAAEKGGEYSPPASIEVKAEAVAA